MRTPQKAMADFAKARSDYVDAMRETYRLGDLVLFNRRRGQKKASMGRVHYVSEQYIVVYMGEGYKKAYKHVLHQNICHRTEGEK